MKRDLNKKVDDLLVAAMNSEVEAKKFYKNAAEKAQSQAGKEFFKELADFENNHYEKVKEMIEARNKGTKPKPYTSPKIKEIRSEVAGEFEPNKDEIVDVLILGIKAEKTAQERYNKIADQIKDVQDQEIFRDLAEDERRHHDLLEAQHYQISNKGIIIWE